MRWVKANQQYLINREPVASIGLVWSQRNTDFYGRDNASDLTDAPYTGFMHALVRARIPYLPIHIDDIAQTTCAALILPNIGALSNQQCAALKSYVAQGGSLLATGATSLYDEYGHPHPDYGLADIFGIHRITNPPTIRRTDIPTLILRQQNKSRLAFLTADIDRRYARLHLTDHADLLKNIIHWIAADTIPVTIEGPDIPRHAPLSSRQHPHPPHHQSDQIKLKSPANTATLLVQRTTLKLQNNTLTIPTITAHEVVLLR